MEKIRALEIKPMEHPRVRLIEPTMKAFRCIVGANLIEHGKVEAKKLGEHVYAIFNTDRFLANLEPNRQIGDDIIAGNMYIVATDNKGVPISLTDKQVIAYSLKFYNIEMFDDIDVAEANINTLMSRLFKDEECDI